MIIIIRLIIKIIINVHFISLKKKPRQLKILKKPANKKKKFNIERKYLGKK